MISQNNNLREPTTPSSNANIFKEYQTMQRSEVFELLINYSQSYIKHTTNSQSAKLTAVLGEQSADPVLEGNDE